MHYQKNTSVNSQQGFTIVELLIVIVIIAILATISIVNYNGAINSANASSADATVATWKKKLEIFNADAGRYPRLLTQMNDASKPYYMDNSTLTANAATNPTAANGKNDVRVQACGTITPVADADVLGMRITYWDYRASTPAAVAVNIGTTTNCATNFN